MAEIFSLSLSLCNNHFLQNTDNLMLQEIISSGAFVLLILKLEGRCLKKNLGRKSSCQSWNFKVIVSTELLFLTDGHGFSLID